MNQILVNKAKKLGKKLIELTNNDSKERSIFFTEDEETILVGGNEKVMNFLDLPKEVYDELQKFHDRHKKQDDFSAMHSHPYDVTFSPGDIKKIKLDYDEDGITHQFITTCNHLYALSITPNLKGGLKLSDNLLKQVNKTDVEIWKKVDIKEFKKTELKGGKILIAPIIYDDAKRRKHDVMWNKEFTVFFKRWNYINSKKLEYEVFTLET